MRYETAFPKLNCVLYPVMGLCSKQDGKVAIRRVANLLLCIYATDGVGLGLLKAKVRSVSVYVMYQQYYMCM